MIKWCSNDFCYPYSFQIFKVAIWECSVHSCSCPCTVWQQQKHQLQIKVVWMDLPLKKDLIFLEKILEIPTRVLCRSLKAGYSCWTRLEGFWEGQKNDASINFRINFIHLIPKRSLLSDQLVTFRIIQEDYIFRQISPFMFLRRNISIHLPLKVKIFKPIMYLYGIWIKGYFQIQM